MPDLANSHTASCSICCEQVIVLSKSAVSTVMGAVGFICYEQVVNYDMGTQRLSKQDESANGLSSFLLLLLFSPPLSNYNCFAGGLLELYQVTGETKWLQWCQKLQTTLDELFWDQAAGEKVHACIVFVSIVFNFHHDHLGSPPPSPLLGFTGTFKSLMQILFAT